MSKQIRNKIAVIMCTWQRFYWLGQTLELLEGQSFKDFDFFIFNNNLGEANYFNNINLNDYFYKIEIIQSEKNIGGMGRFEVAHKFYTNYDKFVFIDDDQVFGPDLLQSLFDKHKKDSILGWWAWEFYNNNYFDRTRVSDLSECDYVGTGGMICDAHLFEKEDVLNIPRNYEFIEDLWLSFYAKHERGFRLLGYQFPIEIMRDGIDQYHHLKEKKAEFLKYLVQKYNT